jgi:hypothetical protein
LNHHFALFAAHDGADRDTIHIERQLGLAGSAEANPEEIALRFDVVANERMRDDVTMDLFRFRSVCRVPPLPARSGRTLAMNFHVTGSRSRHRRGA